VTDYLKAEDLLVFFGIGDGNNDGKFNLDDLAVHISKVVDHGAGKAVDLFFTEGSEVTINTVGTGSVHSLDDLIATGVQIEAH
jgi:hypothetical protein